MEVCSSTEMGAPGALHLGTGDHGPKTDRSRPRSVPVNALLLIEVGANSQHGWQPGIPAVSARWSEEKVGEFFAEQ
jgi:hypothetical protein